MMDELSPTPNVTLADRYSLQERLNPNPAEGSRQTWLAEDLCDRKKVVVKLAPLNVGLNWADFKLFEREAMILQVLDHERIPKYLDFLELDTPNYQGSVLVQDYIEARSFQAHVESGTIFTANDIKEIAIQLLEILSYLHGLNPPVIHRDIKPSNVLLGDRSGHSVGNVYLVDFGAVQTVASAEYDTFTVVGTYGYMPFEQFGGRCVSASDLYSVGATIIYLLTQCHPADLLQINGQLEFKSFVDLDWTFHQWLQQMTAPSVSQRFKTAQEALGLLKSIDIKAESSLQLRTSKQSTITIQRTPDKLEIQIVGYQFSYIMSKIETPAIMLLFAATFSLLFASGNGSFLQMLGFMAFAGVCLTGYVKNIDKLHKEFVANLIVVDGKLTCKFKILTLLWRERFDIGDTRNISKIEQILYTNSLETSLILWNGARSHSLLLNEKEGAYVGKQLSSWLGVPFKQRKVTHIPLKKESKKVVRKSFRLDRNISTTDQQDR